MVMFEEHQLTCIRRRNHVGLYRESEGFIVPIEGEGQHNLARGKEPYFVRATEEWKAMEIAERLSTPWNRQDTTEEALLLGQVK